MKTKWRGPTNVIVACLAVVSAVAGVTAASAAEPGTSAVRINEVESNGGTPGDWVELVNTGAAAVDVSGWVVKDNDDTHSYVVASGATVAPGGFLTLDVDPSFGLGAADSARLFQADGTTLVDTYSWSTHAVTTYGRCPDGAGAFVTTTSSTKGAANDCSSPVRVNEVESNGGTPGDWVELVNTGTSPADVSGWIVKDNDDSHSYAIGSDTTMAAGAFLALDVDPSFGLGGADSARLFTADGATLVDSYSWTAHASTTYGRCPDGTGAFATTAAATKGAANACPGQTAAAPWPGGAAAAAVDDANTFGTNMSGLAYQGSGTATPGALWAVKNGPGTLYRLGWNGTTWTPDTADGFAAGKALHYPTGTGDPDSEGVTFTGAGPAGGMFVATERDNSNSGVSRPAILRFDPSGPATSLNATKEWVLTGDLPPVGPNLGLEAISWISDSFLASRGFVDEHTGAAYNPSSYPHHGDGLFFVGVEANGMIYAYALDQAGGEFTRVATIASGFPGVMDLQFEAETNHLWAVCDDTCTGRSATLDINAAGRFTVTSVYERPSSMPNFNNEGFAIAPQSECVDGHKPVFWSDDSNDDGHALRGGTLSCTVIDPDADDDGINDNVDVTFPPGTSQAVNPANNTFSDALAGGSTSGRILSRAGNDISVADAGNPSGVAVSVGAGTGPGTFQLTGSAATVALGSGRYVLTNSGKTSTVTTVAGVPAIIAVTVNSIPITLTVGVGESVTYTEAAATNGTVTGLTDIRQTGIISIRASDMPATACGAIAIANVIISTAGNAQITGTSGDDLIIAKVGNVTVNGNGGSDCIVTSSGTDRITTADGDDWIDAGGGNNVINVGAGNNTVSAASGNDQVSTGAGNDLINAGGGNNTIDAGGGANVVTTESGNDKIVTGDSSDTIDAGNGNNTVTTGAGNDTVKTGSGNDTVDCGAGADGAHIGGGNNTNVANRCETFTR